MKTKLFIVSLLTFIGLFTGVNKTSAQYIASVGTNSASNISNNSATLNGFANSSGSINLNAWFEWGISSSYYSSQTNQTNYSTSNNVKFSYYLSGLAQNTIYYYRAVVQSSNGQVVYGNQMSLRTTNNYVCTSNCYASQPVVMTYSATAIGTTSAVLNGYVDPNGYHATRWFELGGNSNFSNSTKKIGPISYPSNFSELLNNLSPSTTYYYRAVAQNSNGIIVYGNASIFITNSIPVPPINNVITPPTQPAPKTNTTAPATSTKKDTTTVNSKPSLVVLGINQNGKIVKVGGIVEYVVDYKNISTKNLKDVLLQISLPKELKFIEASRGHFSGDNNSLLANIDNLKSKEEGSVRVSVQIRDDAEVDKIVITTANLAYTVVDNKIQEEVFAYGKNIIEDERSVKAQQGSQQGALAFLSGDGFLPSTLLGWLLLLLVITLLILAARKAYYGPNVA